jgi:hypothetical protein
MMSLMPPRVWPPFDDSPSGRPAAAAPGEPGAVFVRRWHEPGVFGTAANPSGYKVTFPVLARHWAYVLLTLAV